MRYPPMIKPVALAFPFLLALTACAATPPPVGDADPVADNASSPLAKALTLTEWRKAENRDTCAPVLFKGDGGVPATARRADFAGGWAVAFDTPTKRSAYGIAGVGLLNSDQDSIDAKRNQLQRQWPYFKEPLAGLPQPSFAGYGLEGASAYPANNPKGTGADSLAYVRIAGQTCMYNVWSKVSRAHLEYLLDNMQIIEQPNR